MGTPETVADDQGGRGNACPSSQPFARRQQERKTRRVDISRELRRVLLKLRDDRLVETYVKGEDDILDEYVFPSPEGGILDPDNLYHRYFRPVLTAAGIRKIRLHDLRHTFRTSSIQVLELTNADGQAFVGSTGLSPPDPGRRCALCGPS